MYLGGVRAGADSFMLPLEDVSTLLLHLDINEIWVPHSNPDEVFESGRHGRTEKPRSTLLGDQLKHALHLHLVSMIHHLVCLIHDQNFDLGESEHFSLNRQVVESANRGNDHVCSLFADSLQVVVDFVTTDEVAEVQIGQEPLELFEDGHDLHSQFSRGGEQERNDLISADQESRLLSFNFLIFVVQLSLCFELVDEL